MGNSENIDTRDLDKTSSGQMPDFAVLDNDPLNDEKKTKYMMREMTMMAMQRLNKPSFDISGFDKDQKDRLLDIMDRNENNAFEYSKKKLEVQERLGSKALDASITDQKTLRYVLWGGGLSIFLLMILILFFKDEYFIDYLVFVAGLGSGFGLKSLLPQMSSNPPKIEDKDDQDD